MSPHNRLGYALDRDILAFTQSLLDGEHSPLPQPSELHNNIVRSNSSLKRRPRSQLQASIQRVLEALKSDREAADTMSMDESSNRGINRRMTEKWANLALTAPSSASMAIPTAAKRSLRVSEAVSKRMRSGTTNESLAVSKFHELGGIAPIVKQFRDLVGVVLKEPQFFTTQRIRPICGILLHGPPGCGKTEIARHLATSMDVSLITVSAPSLMSGSHVDNERALREHFEEARRRAPCIIFIDDIDAIANTRQTSRMSNEARLVPQLLACMDELNIEDNAGRSVIVIGATRWLHSIDLALRRPGRFGREIHISIPDEPTRKAILEAVAQHMPARTQLNFDDLSRRTPGYVGADLRSLIDEIVLGAKNRYDRETEHVVPMDSTTDTDAVSDMPQTVASQPQPNATEGETGIVICQSDVDRALSEIQPSLMREGFTAIPEITWKDVGAHEGIKEHLEMTVVLPFTRPDVLKDLGGHASSSGVLLWGPPGCGKTLLAKALANACKVSFIGIKGPEMMSKYVGDSERGVRILFDRARDCAPCIVFFDELDAIAPRRAGESTESANRVVATLLAEMDGLAKRQNICVIGTTNRPGIIDPALLRPGRFEDMIFVALPDAEERVDILRAQCNNNNMAFNDTIASIARSCERFSGADLEGLRKKAHTEALKRIIRDKTGNEVKSVEIIDWQKAASEAKCSVSIESEREYEEILKNLRK